MIGSEGFWTGRIMKMFNTQWSAIDYGHCLVKERSKSRGVKSACRVVKHGGQDTSDCSNLAFPDSTHMTR